VVLDTKKGFVFDTLYSRTLEILLNRASARRRLVRHGSFDYALHEMSNIPDCGFSFQSLGVQFFHSLEATISPFSKLNFCFSPHHDNLNPRMTLYESHALSIYSVILMYRFGF
jgi:hypothetical protein